MLFAGSQPEQIANSLFSHIYITACFRAVARHSSVQDNTLYLAALLLLPRGLQSVSTWAGGAREAGTSHCRARVTSVLIWRSMQMVREDMAFAVQKGILLLPMWEGLGSSQRQAAGILPLLSLDASSVPGSVFPSKVSLPQAMLLSVTKICRQSLLLKRKFHVAWSYLFRLAPNPPLQLIHLYSSTVTPIVLTRSPCRYVYLQESLWDDWNVIKKLRPDVFSQIMFSRLQQSFQKGGEGRETRENLYCSALTREFPKEYTRKIWILLFLFFSFYTEVSSGLKWQ